jgi:hypothetical protein
VIDGLRRETMNDRLKKLPLFGSRIIGGTNITVSFNRRQKTVIRPMMP